jgi:hypothetical protein
MCVPEAELTSVEVPGQVVAVTDPGEVSDIIKKFQERVGSVLDEYWVPPIAQIEAGQYVVCRVVPDGFLYKNFARGQLPDGKPQEFYLDLT